ncbi:SWIB/MDM2 domain-containing protein [Copromyces sp. CBS 386.78]|uniref:SWIB/MDM2 domain-containing protein n=1 Tax=Pseudoneurospora amorphoporcata TaxID=241081 RepID=A0AAN6SD16_9PEZI|nr:SWIB/MDM2 domain-containing protein [Copromyces sp. CBS 386.78]KAK3949144.1 SWIB/MDM2 domain-containing protein [Pseudoneurospora amorphoporcata]
MSAQFTPEEEATYARVIDEILETADLDTISRKAIRQKMEAAINKDLSDQKHAIKGLIEARFDAAQARKAAQEPTPEEATPEPTPEAEEDDAATDGEIEVRPKKQQKRESSEDADARLAAELQAQENKLSRGPRTRGGGAAKVTKKAKPKAKTPKKKSATRVKSDDDSDMEPEAVEGTKKRKAGGGFQKPFNLSYPLQEVCGEAQLSRPQVVKKLWEHIKANELQDPSDKRQILCDDKLQAVFKQSSINMFQMNKLLGNQLYPIEAEE